MINKVKIQPTAFKKIVIHALRFGNENLEESKEVLGVCLGSIEEEKNFLLVRDVIPLIHGDQIEIGLSKDLHNMFEEIKNKINSEEKKIIGWYLSHPGYALEFTDSDKSIQLYFQNEENPNAIAILIDPLQIKNSDNFAMRSFKLKNYKNPEVSLELETLIEPPKTLEYFTWVKELIENSQRKEPQIINEYGEAKKPPVEDLQEIPISKDVNIETEKYQEKINSLMSGVDSGQEAFTKEFLNVYIDQIKNWTQDVRDGSLKGTEYLRSSLNQLNKTINKGMDGLEGYFKSKFNEIVNVFVKGITESLETSIASQDQISDEISSINRESGEKIEQTINENLKQINKNLHARILELSEELKENMKKTNRIVELMDNNSGKVSELHSSIDELSKDVENDIKQSLVSFQKRLLMTIEEQEIDFAEMNDRYEEIEKLIERLQKLISEIRQIK